MDIRKPVTVFLTFVFFIYCQSVVGQIHKPGIVTFSNKKPYLIQSESSEKNSHQLILTNKKSLKLTKQDASLTDSAYEYRFISLSDSTLSKKCYYAYDATGNKTLNESYFWDTIANKWSGYSKTGFAFDENRNDTLLVYFSWDKLANQWVNSQKNSYQYDNKGKDTTLIVYVWNKSNNQWDCSSKYRYFYNESGKVIASLDLYWNETNNQWCYFTKDETYYNSNGSDTLSVSYIWNNNLERWTVTGRTEHQLNAYGKDTATTIYHLDNYADTLVGYLKNRMFYDSNGNDMLSIAYRWDNQQNSWAGNTKNEYSYNAAGQEISGVYFIWADSISNWVCHSKFETAYDEHENVTMHSQFKWDYNNKKWTGLYKYTNTFNQEGNISQFTCYKWDEANDQWIQSFTDDLITGAGYKELYIILSMITTDYDDYTSTVLTTLFGFSDVTYDTEGNKTMETDYVLNKTSKDPELSSKTYYYFSVHNTNGVNQVTNNNIKIYPNPANEVIQIESTSNSAAVCRIFNNNGQLINTWQVVQGKHTYNIQNLKPGMYHVQLQSNEGVITYKLIKK